MSLNREAILAYAAELQNLKTMTLDVPELGGEVLLRELTNAKARELNSMKDENLLPVMWCIASIINPDGTPAFTAADAPLFDNMSQAAIRRISNAAVKLNGLDQTIEDIEKN